MNSSLEKLLSHMTGGALSKHAIAVDVGAYRGDFSIDAARLGYFETIYSFEANPLTYTVLQEQLATEQSIIPINLAVGRTAGEIVLHVDDDPATGSILPYKQGYVNQGSVVQHKIAMTRLDDFFADRDQLASIALIKIDTQGADLSVLEGAQNTISASRPIIQTEMIVQPMYEQQSSPQQIRQFLQEIDYIEFSMGDIHVDEHGKLAFYDGIFVPREKDTPASHSYHQLDNNSSYEEQIRTLERICEERLVVINQLDAELQRRAPTHNPWWKQLLRIN